MEINNTLKKIFLEDNDCFDDILGQEKVKNEIKSALLMNRHIVIYGPPGIGKTTLAKNMAKLLPDLKVNDCDFNCLPDAPVCPTCLEGKNTKTITSKGANRFVRVQGSPDLSSEDLLGDIDPIKALKYGALSMRAFTPGKIFKANNGVLFFDELNRCPEKLQNALLQVLEERKATIGSYDIDIDANFLFIATMNPHDSNTEKLSDVLLDRFDVIYMDYPENHDIEAQIVTSKAQSMVEIDNIHTEMIVKFVRDLRDNENLEKVPSVRATIGLFERAHSNAFLKGHASVTYEDIQDAVVSVISHRIRLKPSIRYIQEPNDFIRKEFEKFTDEKFSDMKSNESGGDG
jgi:magnesium chelatase subunit I